MKKGFTLIELLAVIVIIGIVALISVPSVVKMINDAQEDSDSQTVVGLVTSAKHYYELYPTLIPAYYDSSTINAQKNSITKLLGAKVISSIQNGTCGYFYVTFPYKGEDNRVDEDNYKVDVGYIVINGDKYSVYCSNMNDSKNCQAGTFAVGTTSPCADY